MRAGIRAAAGQFICFEPMTAPANALRSGMGLRVLAPGERYRARFGVRVEELAEGATLQRIRCRDAIAPPPTEPSLAEIAREWGRIGCIGFGGPPAHIALFRELCVTRREWLTDDQFERAIAATNILPGPASTQLAIYCAWRLRGPRGAIIGGLGFILPGLVMILALSVLFLAGSPPAWIRGAGMGAGAAVARRRGQGRAGRRRPDLATHAGAQRPRVLAYALAGAIAAATTGPWLVLVLLACGAIELTWQRGSPETVRAFTPGRCSRRSPSPAGRVRSSGRR